MTHFAVLLVSLIGTLAGCNREDPVPAGISQGATIRQERMFSLHEQLTETVTSAAPNVMKQSGLAGALGGARVKLLRAGTQALFLPIPQLTDSQVPVCYYIKCTPQDAAIEFRLWERQDSNIVVGIRLEGQRHQEIQIDWSSVVLVAKSTVASGETRPETYLTATPCVQSQADEITKLAADLWPDSGEVQDYAVNIQRFVREMKQVERPRSLDALTILQSGANGICTGNTNLATALLRSRSIPSRSVAAIPPISNRLEMHRIVEYYDDGQWLLFDPSSVQTEIPLEPWQSIIMARTTISDESIAMQPRMGTTVGCPYGQELELVSNRITFWGQEFFWTIAKPIAEFEPSEEALGLATEAWTRYLELGTLSPGQVKAALAKDAAGFVKLLGTK